MQEECLGESVSQQFGVNSVPFYFCFLQTLRKSASVLGRPGTFGEPVRAVSSAERLYRL